MDTSETISDQNHDKKDNDLHDTGIEDSLSKLNDALASVGKALKESEESDNAASEKGDLQVESMKNDSSNGKPVANSTNQSNADTNNDSMDSNVSDKKQLNESGNDMEIEEFSLEGFPSSDAGSNTKGDKQSAEEDKDLIESPTKNASYSKVDVIQSDESSERKVSDAELSNDNSGESSKTQDKHSDSLEQEAVSPRGKESEHDGDKKSNDVVMLSDDESPRKKEKPCEKVNADGVSEDSDKKETNKQGSPAKSEKPTETVRKSPDKGKDDKETPKPDDEKSAEIKHKTEAVAEKVDVSATERKKREDVTVDSDCEVIEADKTKVTPTKDSTQSKATDDSKTSKPENTDQLVDKASPSESATAAGEEGKEADNDNDIVMVAVVTNNATTTPATANDKALTDVETISSLESAAGKSTATRRPSEDSNPVNDEFSKCRTLKGVKLHGVTKKYMCAECSYPMRNPDHYL